MGETGRIVAAAMRFLVRIGYTTWKNMPVRLLVKTRYTFAAASRFLV